MEDVEIPSEFREHQATLQELIKLLLHNLPTGFKNLPKMMIGEGTRPVGVSIEKFSKMYERCRRNIEKRKAQGAPEGFEAFSISFPNSIVATAIDSYVADSRRNEWRASLIPYWDMVAETGYQMLRPQCDTQIHGLIYSAKTTKPLRKQCIAVPVLPVGNCLSVTLLREAYRRLGWHVLAPVWNLARNDRKRNEQVLAHILELKVDGDILLHYVDEWITGSNMKNIVAAIQRAGFPPERLVVTALCNEECEGPTNSEVLGKALKLGGASPLSHLIKIPKCDFSPFDRDGSGLFTQDFGRLASWRKISVSLSVLKRFFDGATALLKDLEIAKSEIKKVSAEREIPLKISDEELDKQFSKERKIIVDNKAKFWEIVEESFITTFPGAPYIVESGDEMLFEAISRQEIIHLNKSMEKLFPLTAAIQMPRLVSDESFLDPYNAPLLRNSSRIPYHLIRLRQPESGPAEAFEKLLVSLAGNFL